MARRWARVKGIMDRMDWDKEVEMMEVEEEFVVVVILCNAMRCNLHHPLRSLLATTHLSTRLLLVVFGACKHGHHIASYHLGWLGCSAAKCVILAIASYDIVPSKAKRKKSYIRHTAW